MFEKIQFAENLITLCVALAVFFIGNLIINFVNVRHSRSKITSSSELKGLDAAAVNAIFGSTNTTTGSYSRYHEPSTAQNEKK